MFNKKEFGLVLAGGGTKGSYQVGCLKALKELGINITSVVGTSIGSINAALFVQGDIDLLESLYYEVHMENILKLSDKNSLVVKDNLFTFKNIKKIMNEYFSNTGVSNEPLKNLIDKYINTNKIYRSRKDFGLMTYDLKKVKGLGLFKEDIPRDNFKDYILASACFPLFKPQRIDDKLFLDGGLYDNMPMNMLIDKGYKNIILIDVSGIGVLKKSSRDDIYYKIIKPDEYLGGTFDFNKNTVKKNIMLGYLDTMKVFHKLMGENFYFTKIEYLKLLYRFRVDEIRGLEEAGMIYKLDKYKTWKANEFIEEIIKRYNREWREFNKIKLLSISSIKELIKGNMSVSLCTKIINDFPTLLSTYKGRYSNYFLASYAIQEAISQKKNKIF